ncbi:Y+l amino acid transporter 1 [Plakobranchus ocellatus]|uniref:Y+l amino acid transporter 1 n=1 Tax=Plakobranchus ocellatus TaxID=259542 RepID=A0AAV4C206_9GAST|nr:Y+l amino acid transporter 1 [Plakobranchus ocellatus]
MSSIKRVSGKRANLSFLSTSIILFIAFQRRGSAFPSRRSVSWTIKHSKDAPGAEDEAKDDKQAKPVAPPGGDGLGKEIGLLYGGSLVVNAIIGPGIFGTPKGVLAGVGSVGMCMVMWVFAGTFSMCAALCFAELRESVKREGVEYAYITEAFGPLAGFVYSWMRIAAAEPCSTAVFALAFTDYVSDVIYDDCGPPKMFVMIVATLATLSMALVNVMSTKLSERLQMVASVGKVAALSTVVVIGIMRLIQGETDTINTGFQGSKYNPTALGMACYNGLWAFGGWSNVNQVTSGIKKPPRNVPRVIKFILPFVLVLYLLVVLSFFTTMTKSELLQSQAIGVTWAERILGPASSLISVSVGLICLGSLNATFLSAGRLSGVAAKNGQMPDVVSWVHVSSKTPLISVCFRCLVAILLVCVATGQELLRFNMFTVWLFHGSSILALLILRYKNKKKKRPYKVDIWIPVLVVTITCFLLLSPFLQKPERTFIVALVLIALSLLSYHPINWLKSKDDINVPDKLIIWLQLFFRVAPKRDLRREKRSIMRRMSMFARDSILITPNVVQSPEQMRRFSRRMSRMSRREGGGPLSGSPALIRRLAELDNKSTLSEGLRRRCRRGSSMAEADGGAGMKRWRSNSMWAFRTDSEPSPAIIRKKQRPSSKSFTQADFKNLPSPPSLPILKNRFNTTPEATENSAPGALAPPENNLLNPHSALRPIPSPIPEEEPGASAATTPTNEMKSLGRENYTLRKPVVSAQTETGSLEPVDGDDEEVDVELEYEVCESHEA